ncbi:MAG: pentapeptide repeat-containing protein [Roseofilum sp. SBFL]|uniref:pentapeptide repeat-containing protein n=1 Tax=unclassified Roseofilum TaxID=2620099 RepID=UPI001B2CE0B3|nr:MULTISPECIES: pentapeptide repeat-containing protein [unclassified Roseofilum]MBP0013212.1 pentapeptide repeat-containing protein [Roseofilum sp. SID3]MBP0022938.1 pentapeptide repeat-containing protein [Roseofilum sp. SID2]MBP0036206.1 pentapeptide repeat-containing protein [Roseofilum sp. SID1]MBP0042896.1 pentapeptide repeat-containing protein [Roseofilum sp. SBFL]
MPEPTDLPQNNDLKGQKPISIWFRPINVKFGGLGNAIASGAISLGFGDRQGVVSSGLSALQAIGLKVKEPGTIAWFLVQHSLLQAMSDLLRDYRAQLAQQPDFQQLGEQLDTVMEQSDFSLSPDFFEHPKRLPIVEACQAPYKQWLQDCGLSEHEADAIAYRLPRYFVFALIDQWRRNRQDYVVLEEELDTPFTNASDREQAWLRYSAWLQRRADEPMFAEAFSLRQIYIPLRGYTERKTSKDRTAEGLPDIGHSRKEDTERVVVDLFTALDQWVQTSDKDDAVRVICGGPGCGKSSFCKMFADRLIKQQRIPVLFIPLHQFDLERDLIDGVEDFIQADLDGILPPNPLNRDHPEKQILIIFDGLDELLMQGKSLTQAVQDFVREVLRKLIQFNRNEARVLILMSGREVVVQNNHREFRQEKQILHMLPYVLTEEEQKQRIYVGREKLLKTDLRQQWWQKYGQLKAKGYTALPDELDRDNLAEITAQPLLNYLIALSYGRGGLDFSRQSNLNVIYEDLLKQVYERDWAGYQHPSLGTISQGDFIRILEEIGIACWHGHGRTATVKSIEARCASGILKRVLGIFQGGAQEGVTRLLTAFYFRQSGTHGGDATFEFTHKSFGEYLIVRRIVLELRLMCQQLSQNQDNSDIGWDEKECLRRWAILCGPSYFTTYLLTFLRDEIKLQPPEEVERWQDMLCELIGYMLEKGMPMEQVETAPRYLDRLRFALHAEEVLLAALSSCAWITQKISHIPGIHERMFGMWLGRLCGQRSSDADAPDKIPLLCLNHLNLQGYALHYRDFVGANLQFSDLSNAYLMHSLLMKADLSEANLSGSKLNGANLSGAFLSGVNLSEADLSYADFSYAIFNNANLSGADLHRTDLTDANLSGADFRGANLTDAILSPDLRESLE